jgi:hypothetical protein
MKASPDSERATKAEDRGGPVARPTLVLAVLIASCVGAGYVIYLLIKGMHL